jgi:flavodoxin
MAESHRIEHIAQPLATPGRDVVILYGTETGNSEEIAHEVGEMTERLHFQTVVDEMNSFSLVCSVNVKPSLLSSWVTNGKTDVSSVRYSSIFSGSLCFVYNWPRRHA